MATHTLNAKPRTEKGKNACYRIRQSGDVPAVIYSHGESEPLQVNAREFNSNFKGHISESMIIDLNIEGKDACQVFVKDYQMNPVTDVIEHIDFFKITKGEKVHTMIPLKIEGTPAGARTGGTLEINDREVEVKVLPKDLPEELVIDVSALEVGEAFHISDIKGPESMSFVQADDHVIAFVTGKARDMETESPAAEEVVEESAGSEG